MSRLPSDVARARRLIGVGVVGAVISGFVLAGASAQEAQPQPTIERAPSKLGFAKALTIRGQLENGAAGDLVSLQRTTPSDSWTNVRTAPVDDDLEVRFRLKSVRKSARYRLLFAGTSGALADDGEETLSTSSGVLVRVKPKLTLRVRPRHVMAGRSVRVKGVLRPHSSGRRVTIKRRAADGWATMARPRVREGRFSTRMSVAGSTRSRVKAVFRGDGTNTGAVRSRRVVVYDPDLATWYGPGLYGNRTACGQTLGYETVGVAHRTLPCGTKVGILYQGRSITVRVIDRGPFGSAEWDLTRGAAARLGFSGSGTVGTVH